MSADISPRLMEELLDELAEKPGRVKSLLAAMGEMIDSLQEEIEMYEGLKTRLEAELAARERQIENLLATQGILLERIAELKNLNTR